MQVNRRIVTNVDRAALRRGRYPCVRQRTVLRRRAGILKNGDVWTTKFDRESLMNMNLHLSLGPLVSLIAGVLILFVPRLLNYIVAIYLIIMGLLGLFGGASLHLR